MDREHEANVQTWEEKFLSPQNTNNMKLQRQLVVAHSTPRLLTDVIVKELQVN